MACGWKSSLEVAGTLVAATPSPGSIPNPLGGLVSPRGGLVVIWFPLGPNSGSAEFCVSVVFEKQLVWV